MDGVEFNLVVRSLGSFLKHHKGVGLIIIDGLHAIDHSDFTQNKYDKRNLDKQINE